MCDDGRRRDATNSLRDKIYLVGISGAMRIVCGNHAQGIINSSNHKVYRIKHPEQDTNHKILIVCVGNNAF